METWELVARESIRDIVARYNSNGDSGRIDAMMTLFSPDAILEVNGSDPVVGRESICRFFSGVVKPRDDSPVLECLHHHTATLQIDIVDEESAMGRSYYAVFTQNGLDHWGRYVDQYCHLNQRWLFQRRKVYLDGATPGGWGEARMSSLRASGVSTDD